MSSVNIFLKLKLVKGGQILGPSTTLGHIGDMLLHSIRWSEENSGVAGGKGGNLSVRSFEFTKTMCPGSMALLLACASCDVVQEAVISCRGTNTSEKADFLKWVLTNGVVSHYEMEATAKESVVPSERVSIRFQSMAVEFKPRDALGNLLGATLSAQLDLGANSSSS